MSLYIARHVQLQYHLAIALLDHLEALNSWLKKKKKNAQLFYSTQKKIGSKLFNYFQKYSTHIKIVTFASGIPMILAQFHNSCFLFLSPPVSKLLYFSQTYFYFDK